MIMADRQSAEGRPGAGPGEGHFSGRRRIGRRRMHDHGSDGHGHTGETGLGMAGTEQGRIKQEITEQGQIKQEITERERIERQFTGRGGTEILSRILEDTHVLQSSIKGQGESLLSFGNQNSLYTGPPVIAVDAGHGGEDEGASQEGVMEKDINLAIAERLKVKLEDMGYAVVMVREDDTYRPKEERVEAAHKVRAGAYVSIHQNTWEDAAARGIETWYSGKDGASDSGRLAALVHKEAVRSTGAEARELRGDAEFTVTGQTFVPSCLIETGFLSNPRERERLTDPQYQEKLAGALPKALICILIPKPCISPLTTVLLLKIPVRCWMC